MIVFDKIRKIIETCGSRNQMVIAIEELSELQKELCKALRLRNNKSNIVEEIADVHLILLELQLIYEIDPYEIERLIDEKLNRTLQRIEEGTV